jgi:dTDP-4-dehydrorhamnose reductase
MSSDWPGADLPSSDPSTPDLSPQDVPPPAPAAGRGPVLDRVLILGAKGQLGSALVEQEWPVGTFVLPAIRQQLDLNDRGAVVDALARWQPKVVVNAAAYTSVDQAEDHPETAIALNHRAVSALVEATTNIGARLVHVSTDYVFDGATAGWYREHDQVNPLNAYGRSKRAGELAALEMPDSVVIRTSWLYGRTGHNFVRTIRDLGRSRSMLEVVDDQRGCPTSADDLARAIVVAISAGLAHTGLFHVAAPDCATWWELADEVLRLDGTRDRVDLRRVTTETAARPARRPADSRISSEAFATAYGHTLPSWRESLPTVLAQLDRQEIRELSGHGPTTGPGSH